MFPAAKVNAAAKEAITTKIQGMFSKELIIAATITDANAIMVFIGRIILKTDVTLSFNFK